MKQLLLGNEAIARGAIEAGVRVVSSYPGTPSTEITECIAALSDPEKLFVEWAPNEKVALEVALGASVAGGRALCCMKHVGLNVAADPLFTAAYTGVNGGLVIVVADDPGMHSSQNEQDSRFYARSAHIPMLEPSDSGECLAMLIKAYELSETYDTPVLMRVTTRIAHARSLVEPGEERKVALKDYAKDPRKYVMMPNNARGRHVAVEARENALARDANRMDALNIVEIRDKSIGVITSGAAYQYVREALPHASTLKLGMVYPLPMDTIRAFAAKVDELIVIEDMEPFFEDAIRAAGIPCSGKDRTGLQGELFVRRLAGAFGGAQDAGPQETEGIPQRPPVLCPGCPHRAVFHILNKLKLTVCADIGCYTLGALPPLSAVDTVVCMGASVGMAHGFEKARGPEQAKKTVAVIGDSTFLHSGITGLIDVVYNSGHSTVMILDNSITGMTGHQDNPSTGKDARGNPAPQLDLVKLCEAVGVSSVRVVDPYDLPALEAIIKEETAFEGPSVIIARRPCALLDKRRKQPLAIDNMACKQCGACMRIGCPAIVKEGNQPRIDASLCVGCGLCVKMCRFGAIGKGDAE